MNIVKDSMVPAASITSTLIVSIAIIIIMILMKQVTRLFHSQIKVLQASDYQIFNKNSGDKQTIFALIGYIVSFLIMYYAYVTHYFNMDVFFNSDELYVYGVLKDILTGGLISDWYLAPAGLFLFPDFLIGYCAYSLTNTVDQFIFFYAIIQFIILATLIIVILYLYLNGIRQAIIIWILSPSFILCG